MLNLAQIESLRFRGQWGEIRLVCVKCLHNAKLLQLLIQGDLGADVIFWHGQVQHCILAFGAVVSLLPAEEAQKILSSQQLLGRDALVGQHKIHGAAVAFQPFFSGDKSVADADLHAVFRSMHILAAYVPLRAVEDADLIFSRIKF